jgi:hypothetical protein
MIQQRGPDGKRCVEGPFSVGTGFAESLFTVTDFSDSLFFCMSNYKIQKMVTFFGKKALYVKALVAIT